MRDRERLIGRIRSIRRAEASAGEPPKQSGDRSDQELIRALEARVAHLEDLLQGLQDSVHREATRQGKRIAELETRIEPAELSRSLSEDARQRGL